MNDRLKRYTAVILELAMMAEFAHQRSWIGLTLCGLYAWYSATWSVFVRRDYEE